MYTPESGCFGPGNSPEDQKKIQNIITASSQNIIDKLYERKIPTEFIDIMKKFFQDISDCLGKKMEICEDGELLQLEDDKERLAYWQQHIAKNPERILEIEKKINKLKKRIEKAEKSIQEKTSMFYRLKDCIDKRMRAGGYCFENDKNIIFPECSKTLLIHSPGKWKFHRHLLRRKLIGWWLKCYKKNKYTAIFSEAWDPESFEDFKGSYISNYRFDPTAEHHVIFIQYDLQDGFMLKDPIY